MNLELMALRWLRWEKKCPLAFCERSPRSLWCGEPDAIGITRNRYMIEIEIKRSVSDFKADFTKRSRMNRAYQQEKFPKQFYYLVPYKLVPSVEHLLPEWAGLMRGPTESSYSIAVVHTSPVNKLSQRLSVHECARLVLMVNNHAMTVLERHQSAIDRFKDGHWQWPQPEFEI
jgi:hypothetical protein